MSTMNDYAMYRMHDSRRVELEREARDTAVAASVVGRRRRWRRPRRADGVTTQVSDVGRATRNGGRLSAEGVALPVQRVDEPAGRGPVGRGPVGGGPAGEAAGAAVITGGAADHQRDSARAGDR